MLGDEMSVHQVFCVHIFFATQVRVWQFYWSRFTNKFEITVFSNQ